MHELSSRLLRRVGDTSFMAVGGGDPAGPGGCALRHHARRQRHLPRDAALRLVSKMAGSTV